MADTRAITASVLNAADILVSTTKAISSTVIRAGTFSSVSHAALYIGGGQVIEALGEGVLKQSVEQALMDDSLSIAYRHPKMGSDAAQKIVAFADKQVGKSYDFGGVAWKGATSPGAKLLGGFGYSLVVDVVDMFVKPGDGQDKFYCSELVFAAYADAGLSLGAVTSPPSAVISLGRLGRLQYVGHLKGA